MWNNQAGDGGFDQQGGFASPAGGGFSSPQSQGGEKRARPSNIIPCTIAQVLSANHDGDRFIADGFELHQVTIVGLVKSVSVAPTRIDYGLDDGTGPIIEVKQFVDNDESVPEEERVSPMMENTYVRVYGNLRSFQGKQNITAFKVLPITDMNELTSHILETIKVHLELTQPVSANQTNGHHETNATPAKNTYAGAMTDNSMSNVQQQVLTIIRGSASDEAGISIQNIMQQLRGLPEKAIRDSVEFLSGEGHIFSTIDDDHYRSTDTD
ncbi:unnamed protein product [Owenia fusiformis]|uniref:Replication protein A C-terminal domain-containing protein n=1 Tax=Owenia fusiformis TaxID=6347 RepID=A0A8J1Y0G4_OWEFU|nr:unnamed protein product [Owenia fusiformis]